jgi:hypothetical protein
MFAWFTGGVLFLTLTFWLASLFLPTSYVVERAVVIQSEPEHIHHLVNNLHNWLLWSAFGQSADESTDSVYAGPAAGLGAMCSWRGRRGSRGQSEIALDSPETGIILVEAIEADELNAVAHISYEVEGLSTRVRWTEVGSLSFPLAGYFVPSVQATLETRFAESLEKLKRLVESQGAGPGALSLPK